MKQSVRYTRLCSRTLSLLLALLMCVAAIAGHPGGFAASALGGDPVGDQEWEDMKEAAKNRQRRVIYNNDGDDAAAYNPNRVISIENYLSLRTTYLKDYDYVDTIYYVPTSSCFGHLTTRGVGEVLTNGWPEPFPGTTTLNIAPWMHAQGTDPLQLQIDFAREHGKEIFVGLRMNDTHDSTDRDDAPNKLYSQFKREHPELIMKPDRDFRSSAYGDWSAFDYTHEEMRAYFLDVVKDMLDNYLVDGIDFDFFRHPQIFKSVAEGGYASDEERAWLTEMFRQVRSYAEALGRSRGKPILISMRLPDSADYCRDLGIDLETWLDEGLMDIVVGGGYFHLSPWESMADLCHAHGVLYYANVELPDTAVYHNSNPKPMVRRAQEAYFARATAAFAAGVDGIAYFNLFSQKSVRDYMRPDLDTLKYENKRYFISDRTMTPSESYVRYDDAHLAQLPGLWSEVPALVVPGGEESRYILEFGDDLDALKAEGKTPELLAVLRGTIAHPAELVVRSEGRRWSYVESDGDMHYFLVPDDALQPPLTTVTLSLPAAPEAEQAMVTIMKGDVRLAGTGQMPWRRLFTAAAEAIVDGSYLMEDLNMERSNVIYPLAMPQQGHYGEDTPFIVRFQSKVAHATDENAVVLRVANGRFVETISLMPEQVKLLSSESSVAMDTTGDFHQYELIMAGDTATLSVDGVTVIQDAPLNWTVGSPQAQLVGMSSGAIAGMNHRSILVGSLSAEGTGGAYWKGLQISQPAGSAVLRDFGVQLNIRDNQMQPREIDDWTRETRTQTHLSCGNDAYNPNSILVGEADLTLGEGAVAQILVSDGAYLSIQRVTGSVTQIENGGEAGGALAYWPSDGTPQTRRFELQNGGMFFLNGERPVKIASHTTTAAFLASAAANDLTEQERETVGKGGIVVRPLTQGVHVGALRTAMVDSGGEAVFRKVINALLGRDAETPVTPEDMEGFTGTLTLRGKGLTDISMLRYATNIVTLNISANSITDLSPLAGLTSLTTINASDNRITDVSPLAGLTQLQYLHLFGNDIEDISALSGMHSLVSTQLQDNRISDVTPLSGLTGLARLKIGNNRIADNSPLAALTKIRGQDNNNLSDIANGQQVTVYPGSALFPNPLRDRNGNVVPVEETEYVKNAAGGMLELTGSFGETREAAWTITNTWQTGSVSYALDFSGTLAIVPAAAAPTANPPAGSYTQPQTVALSSATPEATIYYTLDGSEPTVEEGLVYSAPITLSQSVTLKAIAVKEGLHSSGVAEFRYVITDTPVEENFRKAINGVLGRAPEAPVTPEDIEGITGTLTLRSKGLTDISMLRYATGVSVLNLSANRITDITPLAGLTSLSTLNISQNQITDVAPLAGLTNLEYLHMFGNSLEDISAVGGMTKLLVLQAQDNRISDVSPLAGLSTITRLMLGNNRIADISPLSGLPKSRGYDNNNPSDIAAGQQVAVYPDAALFPNPLLDRSGAVVPVIETEHVKNAPGGMLQLVGEYAGNLTAQWDVTNQWTTGTISYALDFRGTLTIAPRVAEPAASLPEGSYDGSQTVELTCATPGAAIHYTTDGSDPASQEAILYTEAIELSDSATLKAVAVRVGMRDSQVAEFAYVILPKAAWTPGEAVRAGDVRVYGDRAYECIQAHTVQADWTPDRTPALWRAVKDPDRVEPWTQPSGAHDAYRLGDRVLFDGRLYESVLDYNVWSPATYPQGWRAIGTAN